MGALARDPREPEMVCAGEGGGYHRQDPRENRSRQSPVSLPPSSPSIFRSRSVAVLRTVVVLSLTPLLLSSCERLFDKGSSQNIDSGDAKVKAGDFQAAIKSYEAALDGSSKTADVHYKLALLYADKMNSPADAMHHFGRYLALAPT